MTTIATNRRALYEYTIIERYTAGIALTGSEVKSVKTGHARLTGSFIVRHGMTLHLVNAAIPPYRHATGVPHDDRRPRTLLLTKKEIASIIGKMTTNGLTMIPLRLYTVKRLVKVECALAKGKKAVDKRSVIMERDTQRTIGRLLRSKGRTNPTS